MFDFFGGERLICFYFDYIGSGCLWLSGITGSIAYNWSQPNMKTSVKIIHARFATVPLPHIMKFCFFVKLNIYYQDFVMSTISPLVKVM